MNVYRDGKKKKRKVDQSRNLITIVIAVEGNPHTWEIIQGFYTILDGVKVRAFNDYNSWSRIFFSARKGKNGKSQTRVERPDVGCLAREVQNPSFFTQYNQKKICAQQLTYTVYQIKK